MACVERLYSRPGNEPGCRRYDGHEDRVDGYPVGCETGPPVETEPSEPEHGESDEHHRHAVGALDDPLASLSGEDRQSQTCGRSTDVDDGSSGEIEDHQNLVEEPSSPDPVSHRRINEDRPDRHEDNDRVESDPLHACTENDGCSDEGEGHLEQGEACLGHPFGSADVHIQEQCLVEVSYDPV